MAANLGAALRRLPFWLWITAIVFSIIAFAPVATWTSWSTSNFVIFCGVTGMLLGLLYVVVEILDINPLFGIVQLIICVIWSIFWLAAGADTASQLSDWGDFNFFSSNKSKLSVACAFSWLNFVVFIALAIFAFVDARNGKGISKSGKLSSPPPARAQATTTAPPGAMAQP